MLVDWIYYCYSSNTEGINLPIVENKATVLGESESTISTVSSLPPRKFDHNSLNSYQWLPIIGGDNYEGCILFSEVKINNQWYKSDNGVLHLNDIKNVKNAGITLSTLVDKIFVLKEWDNFGAFQSRVSLYIPTGKSVSNFFFGLMRTNN